MKRVAVLLLLSIIAGVGYWYWSTPIQPVNSFEACAEAGNPILESYPLQCRAPDGTLFAQDIGNELEKMDFIRVTEPRPNTAIQNPVKVSGQARGSWFFEASFPVHVLDSQGIEIGLGIAQADGEWMTQDFVPFTAEVSFQSKEALRGELVLEKSNPSGLPEHADRLRIPVTFNIP